MYLDVIKKMEYHKERIVKDFIRSGICPPTKAIEEKIAQIDSYLAIFKHYDKSSGALFNVDEYNMSIMAIYNDLKIIYSIITEHLEREYTIQQSYINSHLMQLESLAKMYYSQALHESSSTALGKTLLFKNNSFTVETEDNATYINLGDIAIKRASKIACIANINNCNHDNLIFELKDVVTNEIISSTIYNKYNQSLTMPGEKTTNNYTMSIEKDQKINGSILMNINAKIEAENSYDILAGRNSIQFNDKIIEVPTQMSEHRFEEGGHINFYIINGKSASFKFNKKPLSANFALDDDRVKGLDKIHHFFIEAPSDFQFSIEIDTGEIYATKESGIVNGEKLFYIGNTNVSDFYIIEELDGIKDIWNARLKIMDNNEDLLEIENIIIKELE